MKRFFYYINAFSVLCAVCVLSALVVFFVACTKPAAEVNTAPELILRYADNQPDDYPTTKSARYFAKLVSQRTGGKISIEVYGNGELGNELDVLQQVQFGGIDFSRFSLGTLTEFAPFLAILQLPYLYTDSAHMWRVLDSDIGDYFLSRMNEKGVIGLCWFDAGARSFYTTSKVTTLEQLRSKTIRVQESALMVQMVEALGVTAVQIPYNIVYSALQMNQIDGAENNAPSYVSKGHNAPAPYFLLDEHFRIPEIVVMSRAAQDKIAKIDTRFVRIINECAKECESYERALWTQAEKDAFTQLEETGCEITELDSAEKEKFVKAMQPIYHSLETEYGALIEQIQHK